MDKKYITAADIRAGFSGYVNCKTESDAISLFRVLKKVGAKWNGRNDINFYAVVGSGFRRTYYNLTHLQAVTWGTGECEGYPFWRNDEVEISFDNAQDFMELLEVSESWTW